MVLSLNKHDLLRALTLTTSVQTSRDRPISGQELSQLRNVGERLRAELLVVLESLPASARGVRALGRHLNLDRNTCHRVLVATQQRADDGLAVISKLPGIAALRQFVQAFDALGLSADQGRSLRAAVDQLAQLVGELGGSFSSVQRRVTRPPSARGVPGTRAVAGHGDERERLAMHAAALGLVGRCSDVHLTLTIHRPLPDNPRKLEHVGVNALIGHEQVRAEAMPLALTYIFSASDPLHSGQPNYAELTCTGTGHEMLSRFCSEPMPRFAARASGIAQHQQVIDTDPSAGPIDVVVGCRLDPVDHVDRDEVPLLHNVVRMRYPAKRLVFDVYLHRSLAMSSIPMIGAYAWHPSMVKDLSKYWHERVPMDLSIQVLGPGLGHAGTDAWPRHQELTRYVFTQLGWNADEFVGYRVSQTFPVWGLYYYFTSDFAKTGPGSA